MIICGCNQAFDGCEERCIRWFNKRKPDKVFRLLWPKHKKIKRKG